MSSRTAGSSGASSFSGVAGAWPRKQKVDIYADIQHSHGPWKMMNSWKIIPWSDKNKVKTSTNSEFHSQLWQLCSITRLASYSWDHFWQSHPAGPAGRPPFLSGTSEENGLYISRGKKWKQIHSNVRLPQVTWMCLKVLEKKLELTGSSAFWILK